jgi:DNA mismatch repair protein MSH3
MAWIRQPLVNHIDIENRLDAVEELSKLAIPKFGESSESSQSSPSSKPSSSNDKSRQNKLGLLISLLPTLPDLERGICRIFYNRCSVSEFISVLLGFKQIERCIPKEDEIESCAHSTLLRKILREIPTDLSSHVSYFLDTLNIQSTDKQKRDLFVNDSIFPALREAKSWQAEVERSLEDHLEEIRKAIGKPRLEYITKNKDEYVIEVTPAEGARAPKSWIPLASPKSASRFHTPFIIEKYKELLQCRETLSIEIANAWATFVAEFASRYPIFRSTVESLTSLDCLHSLACIAKIEGYVRPSIFIPPTENSSHDNGEPVEPTDKISGSSAEPHESISKSATSPHSFFDLNTQLTIVNGRHPIVENLLSVAGKQFVPNDTLMGVNEHGQKCTIITGPNMGGKTCYTRQVAVLCVMAQMGSFVPADSMKFTPLDAIYTRMGAYDNLSKGQSTFFVELQETSDIMRLATSRSLVILDELGRGTSTHDGFSIAYATLHHLLTVNKCFTLFVTHYPALSQLTRIYPTLAQNHHISYLEQHPETGKSSMEIISSEGEVLKAGQEVSNNSMDVDVVPSSVLKRNASSSLSEALHQAGPRITFLHKLVKGVEGRSFGMNVARMARLPPQVISSASEKSVMLEANVKRRYSRMAFNKVCELARCGEGGAPPPSNLKESVQAVSRMLTAVVSGTPSS